MKKYRFYVSTCYVGSEVTTEVEFDDDVTEEEIKEAYDDWAWSVLDSGWDEIQ